MRHWVDLCLIGFLIQVIYFGGTYLALRAGLSVGDLALIVSLQPIVVGIVSPVWVKERVTQEQWIGLALGFAGTAIVIVSKSVIELTSPKGIALAVAALLGMTLGMLYEKRTSSSIHVIGATLIQSCIGLLFIAPLASTLEHWRVVWNGTMVLSLAYLVICNSIVAIILLLYLSRRRQAAKVSALFFLVPPCAAIAARFLLNETMPVAAWGGIGVAAIGVWISKRNSL